MRVIFFGPKVLNFFSTEFFYLAAKELGLIECPFPDLAKKTKKKTVLLTIKEREEFGCGFLIFTRCCKYEFRKSSLHIYNAMLSVGATKHSSIDGITSLRCEKVSAVHFIHTAKSRQYPLCIRREHRPPPGEILTSTYIFTPVTNPEAASLAKNTTNPFNSPGSPNLPIGVTLAQCPFCASNSASGFNAVSIYPGAIAFTRIPYGAHSAANDLASCVTPAFEAL